MYLDLYKEGLSRMIRCTPLFLIQYIQKSKKSGFRMIRSIEYQSCIWMTCCAWNPGMASGKAPHDECCALLDGQACIQHVAINLCFCIKPYLHRSRVVLNFYIHLCNLYFKAQCSQSSHVHKNLLGQRIPINAYVHLQTYTVDWHTTFNHAYHQIVNRVRLLIQSLTAIIIVKQTRRPIRFMLSPYTPVKMVRA